MAGGFDHQDYSDLGISAGQMMAASELPVLYAGRGSKLPRGCNEGRAVGSKGGTTAKLLVSLGKQHVIKCPDSLWKREENLSSCRPGQGNSIVLLLTWLDMTS